MKYIIKNSLWQFSEKALKKKQQHQQFFFLLKQTQKKYIQIRVSLGRLSASKTVTNSNVKSRSRR